MNDLPDKPLHDWARQSLTGYEPAVNPHELAEDWQLIQPRLFPRRRPMLWFWLLGLLALTGSLSWYWLKDKWTKKAPVVAQNTVSIEKKPLNLPTMPTPSLAVLSEEKIHNNGLKRTQTPTGQEARVIQQIQRMPAVLVAPTAVSGQEIDIGKVTPMVGVSRVQLPSHSWPVVANRALSKQEQDLEEKLLSGQFGPDSTVFAALTRNLRSWPGAVIVCDLTTSMDPYAAQIYAWFRRNAKNPQVRGVVFFTDAIAWGNKRALMAHRGHFSSPANVIPARRCPRCWRRPVTRETTATPTKMWSKRCAMPSVRSPKVNT